MLRCHYDLEGALLYSLQWYRGTHEFYRFAPTEVPSTKIFNISGIYVDVSRNVFLTAVPILRVLGGTARGDEDVSGGGGLPRWQALRRSTIRAELLSNTPSGLKYEQIKILFRRMNTLAERIDVKYSRPTNRRIRPIWGSNVHRSSNVYVLQIMSVFKYIFCREIRAGF